jgi:aspartate/methionine/tyrosine aminotransferase
MFSSRLPALTPSPLSEAVSRARRAGTVRFDLTESNPTVVGLPYPPALADELAGPAVLSYVAAPLGMEAARGAVARSYGPRVVDPARIMLTASTSEAYSFLFKLLCDPGDDVLVPHPSYPLFELLTALDGVRPSPYRLDATGGWCLDRASLEQAAAATTRAVLVVSPNNPTGSMLRAGDREWLVGFARDRRLALISDEVFADYPLGPRADVTTLLGEDRVLTFTLGGLSKSAGLPQMKLAWTVTSGPAQLVASALERLEMVADSYLSVSTPVQEATAGLLQAGRAIHGAIHERIRHNLRTAHDLVRRAPALTLYEPDGGWSVVLRVPAILSEEQWVLSLLESQGVLVHPGYFFDLHDGVHLVISLLPRPDVFAPGLSHVAAVAQRGCA